MYDINNLKPLTATQYDMVKESALKRIEKRIGDKPTRKQFKREYGSVINILDILSLIVFVSALAISSVHILAHVGQQSAKKLAQTVETAGVVISGYDSTVIQQVGMIVLAEFAMLLFMTLWSMERKKPQQTRTDKFLTHSLFVLALVSMTFVIVANVNTGIGALESIMPPLFTIGVGLRLEHIIVELINRQKEIDSAYTVALSNWQIANEDMTQHPDYQSVMRRAIWDKLVSLKQNASFADANTSFKVQAVLREMERDNWTRYANFDTQIVANRLAIEEPKVTEDDTEPATVSMPAQIENDTTKSVARPVAISESDERHCAYDGCGKVLNNPRSNQKYCNVNCRTNAHKARNK